MTGNPTIRYAYSPGIQVLIPLFYAAWADRVLSPTEVHALRKRAQHFSFLTEDDQTILRQWSNPAKPPSRHLFKYWEIELRNAADRMQKDAPKSLVDLGIDMARRSIQENGQAKEIIQWTSPEIRKQLEELEEALKQVSIGAYHNIFFQEEEEKQSVLERKKSTFDVAAMTRILDGSYYDLRQKMRTLLSDPSFNYQYQPIKEEYREKVLQWCHLLAEQGLGALSFPEIYGGQNDMGKYAVVFEMLGYHNLSLAIKFGVQFGLFGGSILFLGTENHHKKYLKDIGTLALPGCFAMTETGHGSNVRGLETTATYDPATREFIIHSPTHQSGKEYIGNALHGRMASVFAQLIVKGENHGIHTLLVPIRDEEDRILSGIRIEDNGYKMGLNGVDNGRIWFDNVRVPRENLLNRFGDVTSAGEYTSPIKNPSKRFFTMLGTLVGGRVCVPRTGLSATKTGMTIAIRYALRRRQFSAAFNEPETLLLDYPSHQRRLMPLLAKTYALDFALSYLTDRYLKRSPEDIREIETLAAGIKAYSTWFTTQALQECREACGGKGYLQENRFADLKADTDIFTTFEGDNTVLMQLVAKGVLSKFQKEFNEEGVMGMLRFVGGRVSTAITERNPIIIRNTSRDHLLDPEFQLNAFVYREQRLTFSLAQRFRGLIKNGLNAQQAALQVQTHMLSLANAFIERIVLEEFIKVAKQERSVNLKNILKTLCDLFALHTIEQHHGWYLQQEYLSGGKSNAIRNLVDELCATTRTSARALVDAFAIPDKLLGAEIIVKK